MKIRLVCQYCANEWNPLMYENPKKTRCKKCNDTRIKVILPGKRVDYYADDTKSSEEPRKVSYEYSED